MAQLSEQLKKQFEELGFDPTKRSDRLYLKNKVYEGNIKKFINEAVKIEDRATPGVVIDFKLWEAQEDVLDLLTEEVCEDFINYLEKHFYPNKRSEKQMGNEEMWSLYEVIIVDKDDMKVKTAGQDYIIAKSAKMALGKAGYFDLMEEKDYDESKLEEKVVKIMDIKPADEDED